MKKQIIYNKNFDKNKIRSLLEWIINNYGNLKSYKMLDKIKKIGFKYATKAGISLGTEDLIIPNSKEKIIKRTENQVKKEAKLFKLGKRNENEFLNNFIFKWTTTNNLLTKQIIKNFKQTDILNPAYMMIISGARGNLSQIKQIIGFRGLISDSEGKIIKSPIKTNLKEGLSIEDYFISCYGARKGIIDTGLKTANSGYLTRRLVYSAQNIIVKQADCKTTRGSIIKINTETKENYLKSLNKLIGRVINEDIAIRTKNFKLFKGQDLCTYLIKKIIKNKKYILIRKTTNCKINTGTCQLCYGWDLSTKKLIKLGEAVGILAAQSIGEPGTQLTMRTFHTGGIFKSKELKIIEAPFNGTIQYEKKNLIKIKNTYLEDFFSSKKKIIFIKKNKYKIKKILLPKYSIILSKNNKKINKHQILIQIPLLKDIVASKKEVVRNTSLIKAKNDGLFIINLYGKNKNKKTIWIICGKIITNLLKIKNKEKIINFKPSNFQNLKTKKIKKYKNIIRSLLNFNTYKKTKKNFSVKKYNKIQKINIIKRIKKNKFLLFAERNQHRILNKKLKTGILVTRKKLTGQIIEKINEKEEINIIKNGLIYLASKNTKTELKSNTIIEKNNKIMKINYFTEKTNDIVEGLPKVEELLEAKKNKNSQTITNNLHEKLKNIFHNYKKKYDEFASTRKAISKLQEDLIETIAKVYSLQNVNIAEKHLEIIIKQMTSKVLIKQSENKNLLVGEMIDINKVEKINQTMKNKIRYEPIIIGISQIPMTSESFISAACFQETTRILIKSAISGKTDWLKGLKENIIIGKVIPAGTGYKK